MRHVLVHDPAEQQRADDAAEVEAGRDDAEGAAGGTGRRGVAHHHVARRCDHAAEESGEPERKRQRHRRQAHQRNQQHQHGIDREAGRGELAVAMGPVGEIAAGEHARGAGAEECGQRDVGGRERGAVAAHQRDHAEIVDARGRQAQQREERGQHHQRRRDHAGLGCGIVLCLG
ncbi:hypothetical protein chiPu_0032566, partial [Chiloscyllium punctatum]|nr:hypothetical protein [Chiloscyllium punctatum]